MANLVKQLDQSVLTSTLTTALYTVPGSTKTIVKEILLCNTDSSAHDITIYFGDGTAVKNTFLDQLTLTPNQTKFITLSTVLQTGEIISGGDDAGGVVSCTISGVEIT